MSNDDNDAIVLCLTGCYDPTVLQFQVPLCWSYNFWSVSCDWFHVVGTVELRRKQGVSLMTFAGLVIDEAIAALSPLATLQAGG